MIKDFCILIQCNDAYAPYAGTALTSLFENNKHLGEIDVFVLDDKISSDNIKKLNQIAFHYQSNFNYIQSDEIVAMLEGFSLEKLRDSFTTYLKLFVIEQFKDHYDRVIYMDADIIVCGEIDELCDLHMENEVCGMALDLEPKIRRKQAIESPEKWFNAGIIVFNVKNWKEQECTEHVLQLFRDDIKLYFHDQDIINYLFRDKIKQIDSKYNMMTIYKYIGFEHAKKIYGWSDELYRGIKESDKDIRIFHCFSIMGKRPWNKGYAIENEVKWQRYLEITPWSHYEYIKEKVGLVTKVQRVLEKYLPYGIYLLIYRLMYEVELKRFRE